MSLVTKTSPSLAVLKGYGFPQTLSEVEDRWCEQVAASIIEFRLKKEEEEKLKQEELLAVREEEQRSLQHESRGGGGDGGGRGVGNREGDGGESSSDQVLSLHRLNCDLEHLGEDLTDPTEGSFSKGRHNILRVGYNPVSTRNWRNTTRGKKPLVVESRYRPTRRHKAVPSIKVDAPIDGYAPVVRSKGFHWKSKLPPIYTEMKSVLQPSLPTTGNETKFASIPKLVSYATKIWKQEEEEEKRRLRKQKAAKRKENSTAVFSKSKVYFNDRYHNGRGKRSSSKET